MERLWAWFKRCNKRQGLLRLFGWLHCALLLGCFYAAVVRITEGEDALPGAYLRSFLFVVPLALADFAAERVPALWQFGLVSLGITGLSWLLLGHIWAAVPVLVVCVMRARNRMSEEAVDSLMDSPRIPVVLLLVIPFFYSALGGGPLLQRLTLLSAALYLLLCAAYRGVGRIDGYLEINRGMAGVPVRRIVRTSGLALLVMLALSAALVLPALLTAEGYFKIDPQEKTGAPVKLETTLPVEDGPVLPEELTADNGSRFRIPPFVSYLFFALVLAALAAGVLAGIYWLVRNFRGSFTDHRDVVQFLGAEEKREELPARRGRRKLSNWDRSPTAAVRRRYKRTVRKAGKEQPESWCSPEEIEESAGLSWEELHRLYEKARYGPVGCTAEESRSLKAGK